MPAVRITGESSERRSSTHPHRSLPPRPSLAQLKHQAKDLRPGARECEPDALATLRRLRRFAGASDDDIASADIALADA